MRKVIKFMDWVNLRGIQVIIDANVVILIGEYLRITMHRLRCVILRFLEN